MDQLVSFMSKGETLASCDVTLKTKQGIKWTHCSFFKHNHSQIPAHSMENILIIIECRTNNSCPSTTKHKLARNS